jgi:RNA recognition motif-containing protein
MEESAADAAILALDGTEFMGLTLLVEEAKPEREPAAQRA